MRVELVYALPDSVFRRQLELPDGATVQDVVKASGVLDAFPELREQPRLGIFSKAVDADQPVREGDRVELYRPLLVEPMEARRRRARKARS